MKKYISHLVVFTLILNLGALNAQGLTKEEKIKAENLYDNAMAETKEYVKGLSEAQLQFKPSAESWSIAECIEHLALSEELFMQMITKSLQTPEDAAKREEVKLNDTEIYNMITNRDQKIQTQDPLKPSQKWGDTKATMKALKDSRKETISFIKKNGKNLRYHYFQFPFGTVDAYQLLIFGAGHQKRHNAQIMEIKNHPDFPTS